MRYALRNLSAHLGLAATIIGTLGVALAFAITCLSMLNQLLFNPYPYPELRQLVLVRDGKPKQGAHQRRPIAVADWLDVRSSITAFSSVTAWWPQPVVVTSAGAEPERLQAVATTASFFTTLRVVPILGRPFERDADAPGRDGVVVLSRRVWISRFGGDSSIIGREIGMNGRPMTVIGIIRDEDCYPSGVDAWMPLVLTPSQIVEREAQRISVIGRLANGSTDANAAGQLASLAQTLATRYPQTNQGRGFELLPLQREQYEFTAPLFIFVAAGAALVLILAAINVTNLLVARTLDRRRELAVRAMLGASTGRVASTAVIEVLLLAAAATGCGALTAGAVLNAVRLSLPEGIARWFAGWSSLRVDAVAVMGGIGIAFLVASAISILVAMAAIDAAQNSSATSRATRRASWSRRFLVAGEVTLATALLLGASVIVAGFNRISAAFEALEPSRLLKFTLTLPESRYAGPAQIAAFHGTLLERLTALPGVERAALIRNEPASNVPNPVVAFQRDDAPALQPSDMPRADVEVVSPEVFDTLRIHVLNGRTLSDGDGANSARVAVVSQAAARRFWADRDPVGTTIRLANESQPIRIVGVMSDFILNWYDPEMRPVIFLADAQSPARTTTVIVRTRMDPGLLARPVRTAVSQLDNRQPLAELEPLTTTIADSLSPIRIIERLLLVGSALATVLAALGIYGVFAHWVGGRQRELGVRFALGATRMAIARLVLREAVLTAAGGIAVGLGLAIVVIRVASGALLGVPSLDVGAILVVAACAITVTIAGAAGPARRAAHVDVIALLRRE